MSESKFPGVLRINDKGRITFTEEQWDFFCSYLRCQDFSLKYQKQMIKACINGILEASLKEKNALRDGH